MGGDHFGAGQTHQAWPHGRGSFRSQDRLVKLGHMGGDHFGARTDSSSLATWEGIISEQDRLVKLGHMGGDHFGAGQTHQAWLHGRGSFRSRTDSSSLATWEGIISEQDRLVKLGHVGGDHFGETESLVEPQESALVQVREVAREAGLRVWLHRGCGRLYNMQVYRPWAWAFTGWAL